MTASLWPSLRKKELGLGSGYELSLSEGSYTPGDPPDDIMVVRAWLLLWVKGAANTLYNSKAAVRSGVGPTTTPMSEKCI